MNKYIKGKTIINATEKAFNIIYKEQGFVPYKEIEEKKDGGTKDISKMKKDELIKIATEKGIEIPENATKDILVALIKEIEEKKEGADK